MTSPVIAAIDAMSGDAGIAVSVPAIIHSLQTCSVPLRVLLVGDESRLHACIASHSVNAEIKQHIEVIHAPETVAMDASPSDIIRSKADTSMKKVLELVSGGKADVCVSAGNTGALAGLSRMVLSLLPGVRKPAICAQLPSQAGNTFLLDVGATVDCSPEILQQFARMGSIFVSALSLAERPRVRCLSIGREPGKGNALVKQADALLRDDNSVCYEGLIEANELFSGCCEVVVCDGFAGNVALKSSEGTANFIRSQVYELSRSPGRDGPSLREHPDFYSLLSRINPDRFNGACLLGLDALVFKSHGDANVEAFSQAIEKAVTVAAGNLVNRLQTGISA